MKGLLQPVGWRDASLRDEGLICLSERTEHVDALAAKGNITDLKLKDWEKKQRVHAFPLRKCL